MKTPSPKGPHIDAMARLSRVSRERARIGRAREEQQLSLRLTPYQERALEKARLQHPIFDVATAPSTRFIRPRDLNTPKNQRYTVPPMRCLDCGGKARRTGEDGRCGCRQCGSERVVPARIADQMGPPACDGAFPSEWDLKIRREGGQLP